MKTIFLIQHTESEHHVNHHIGAWYEWNLTARGREQAFRSLTVGNIRSIFFTIFRKGALLMNMYGFVSMLPANTENHVRTIVVYDWKFREA